MSVGAVLTPVAPLAGLGDAGAVGGAGGVAVWTLTPANVEVLSCDVSWLVTIIPTRAPFGIEAVVVPTSVHVLPLADT